MGRNDNNIKVIFPNIKLSTYNESLNESDIKPGDYVVVNINESNSQVLKGVPLYKTTLKEFSRCGGEVK